MNNYYITTAINYLNGPPHLGHAYEAICADILARYQRLNNKEVFFLTGSDEHGQKIADKAAEKLLTPIELCDQNLIHFQSLNTKLNISNNHYIRTTDQKHINTCLKVWEKIKANGDIYLGDYSGWYNVREETFVSESEAKKNNYCDPGYNTPLIKTSEPSYFFRMSKYQDQIKNHIKNNPEFIYPSEKRNEILKRLEEPLLDLSVTRTSIDWGIPIPEDPNHVMYVWFDALTNYLSGIDYLDSDHQTKSNKPTFWPANVHIIGKDIVWFHSVIWIAMLLSLELPLPQHIVTHGFINGPNGQKMSKSYGNVVDPNELLDEFHADTIRYYLVREGTFGKDFKFSFNALKDVHDSDLADTIGNTVHRCICMMKAYDFKVPNYQVPDYMNQQLFDLNELKNEIEHHMNTFQLHMVIKTILDKFRKIESFLAKTMPWKMKNNPDKKKEILKACLEAIYILAHYMLPYVPEHMNVIFERLNTGPIMISDLTWNNLAPNTEIIKGDILFERFRQARYMNKGVSTKKLIY